MFKKRKLSTIDLAVSLATTAALVSNTRFSTQGGSIKTNTNLGPFSASSQVGIVGNNFQNQYAQGFDFGFGSSFQSQSSSIGLSGLAESRTERFNFLGFKSSQSSDVSVGLSGIKASGNWEIGGKTIFDYNLSTACCCAPIKQFLSGGFDWLSKGFDAGKALASCAWGFLKNIPWGEVGSKIVEGLAKGVEIFFKK